MARNANWPCEAFGDSFSRNQSQVYLYESVRCKEVGNQFDSDKYMHLSNSVSEGPLRVSIATIRTQDVNQQRMRPLCCHSGMIGTGLLLSVSLGPWQMGCEPCEYRPLLGASPLAGKC